MMSPPGIDEAALRASVEAARRGAQTAQKQQEQLRLQMEAARNRLEVAAQQLAALSAQMYGPQMQRFEMLAGPPHVLIGVQLDDSKGDRGARVREVSPGGPAEHAGIRPGDLIVAVNGTKVQGSAPARRAVELLRGVKPGDKVALEVSRDGAARDLIVTARPVGDALYFARQMPEMAQLQGLAGWAGSPMIIRGPVADMELARLTPALGRYFGTDTGVLVVRAPSDGALGLQDGDVILSVAGRKPIDSSHVIRILGSYDPGEKITLEVLRLHRRISVAATIPAEPPIPRAAAILRNGMVLSLTR